MEWNKNNNIAVFVRTKRKDFKLTQEQFALRSGLGIRFVRELEQGKPTLRIDKVNQALEYFGYELNVSRIIHQ